MFVKGVGMTKFGISDKFSHQLAYDACLEALDCADMSFNKIDAIVCSTLEWFFSIEKQRHFAGMLSSMFRTNKPIIRVPAGCAGGGHALWVANQLGYDNVLVVGVEKLMTCKSESITDEFMMAMESKWEQPEGVTAPSSAAIVAREYLNRFPDTTMDDLALIAYKNHHNGSLNPKARFYGKKVTLEDIKKSPIVATPFNLYDCSISVNGAAAVIISNEKSDIKVIGSALATDYLAPFERKDMTVWNGTVKAGKEAFKQAGVEPKDIDVAELHDAFSIIELIAYEDLGFCKKGEGKELIRQGHTTLEGKMPVNTSGGLKARGHPISPTGVAMIVEIVDQLRNRCGERQVKDAKLGLTHNVGGAGGTTTVHILRKI